MYLMVIVQVISKMSVKQLTSKLFTKLFDSPDYHEPVAGEVTQFKPRALTTADFRIYHVREENQVFPLEMVRAYHKWSEEFRAL